MDKRFKNIIFITLVFLVFGVGTFFLFRTMRKEDDSNVIELPEEKLNVIVSILPQKEFVESVGGDFVEVTELIHPGESPATYSLTTEDLTVIENADVYFRIGYIPFEIANIDKIKEINRDLQIIDLSENIELRYFNDHEEHEHESIDYQNECESIGGEWLSNFNECESDSSQVVSSNWCGNLGGTYSKCDSACRHDILSFACTEQCISVCQFDEIDEHEESDNEVDPHIWLSSENVAQIIDDIYFTLAENDSENKSYYENNAYEYFEKLTNLEENLLENLKSFSGSKLLVFHPSWGYFADHYGLEQVSIEDDGKEPTAEHIQEIVDLINEEEINVIFVQAQFSTEAAESIANDTGAVIVIIDPLAENYIENMMSIGNVIKDNL